MRHSALGGQIGLEIIGERENRVALADFGERRGDAGAEARTPRQGGLRHDVAGRGAIDEFGVGERRRARENDARHVRLVAGEREHDMARRLGGARQGLGEGAAHQRRGVVEHRRQAQRRFGAHLRRQIGIEIGARQRARGLGAAFRISPLRPGEESTHNAGLAGVEGPRPFGDGFDLSHVRLRSIPDLIIASFIADLR